MGFHNESRMVRMDTDRLGTVHHWNMPEDAKTIRLFLGLCNFFRGHIKDYSTLSAPLNRLLRKDSLYSGGPMPSEAQESFTRFKRILCSQPVLAYPSPDKQYALIVDASTGAKDLEGGIGAILTQMDAHGRFSVIAYASRLLQGEENAKEGLVVWPVNTPHVRAIEVFGNGFSGEARTIDAYDPETKGTKRVTLRKTLMLRYQPLGETKATGAESLPVIEQRWIMR